MLVSSRESLLSLRYDGSDRLTHLKVTGKKPPRRPDPPPAQKLRMRDDGRWALARTADQFYLTAVSVVGGDAPAVDVFSPSVATVRLTDIGVDHFAWADGGRTITWSIGLTFYRRSFDSGSFESIEEERKRSGVRLREMQVPGG